MKIKEIKKLAKHNFKSQMSDMMLVAFISVVINTSVSFLTITLGNYVIFGAMDVGLYYVFYKNSRGKLIKPQEALYGFTNRFGPAFLAGFIITLIRSLPTLLNGISIVAKLLEVLSKLDIGGFGISDIYGTIGYAISGTLTVIMVLSYFVILSIQMTTYIMARDPDISAFDAIAKSREMMFGYMFKYFTLRISFIGWGLLALITLGFSRVYSEPYFIAAETVFFNDVYEKSLSGYEREYAGGIQADAFINNSYKKIGEE